MKKPLLIDTHAHINFNVFKKDGDKVIKRALDENIWVINVGAQYSTSRRAVEYAEKYKEGVYAMVGLHPSHVYKKTKKEDEWEKAEEREFEEFDVDKYIKLLENSKTVAVGEIGLDYYDNISEEEKDKQKQIFIEQVELAQQMNKPISLHCRKAYDDLIELLTMFSAGCAHCPHSCLSRQSEAEADAPGLKGVVHCFMGRWSQAEKLMEMGFYISFNGLITYARDYDKVIEKMSLDRIVLETDAPYLTPEPHREERNKPAYVKYVAEKIAEIKKIKFEQVAEQTTRNARELFGI